MKTLDNVKAYSRVNRESAIPAKGVAILGGTRLFVDGKLAGEISAMNFTVTPPKLSITYDEGQDR